MISINKSMLPSEVTGTAALPFQPLPTFGGLLQDEAILAHNQGKRIGILIVTDNALTTFTDVLKRITPEVWKNVEEIAVFDDASQDHTYELAMGLKTLRALPKLEVIRHAKNLGYGGNQKAGYRYFIEKGFDVVLHLDATRAIEAQPGDSQRTLDELRQSGVQITSTRS